MELNFDKEIDALLRQTARGDEAVSNGSSAAHLDADEIAAFAENALPEQARTAYVAHFAECDRCRTILSNVIRLNSETVETVSAVPTERTLETAIPWHRRLFSVPGLAYALGAVVLLFGGFLGFLVLQNASDSQPSEISQITESEREQSPPAESGIFENSNAASANVLADESSAAASDSAMANSSIPETKAANTTAAVNAPASSAKEKRAERKPAATADESQTAEAKADAEAEEFAAKNKEEAAVADMTAAQRNEVPKVAAAPSKPVPAPPPPAAPAGRNAAQADKAEISTEARKKALLKSKAETEPARKISGKTFTRKDGIWYDGAYRGQTTVNIRRGTQSYRKLDSDLRNIAEKLDGTLVVVWKEKAYRIQ